MAPSPAEGGSRSPQSSPQTPSGVFWVYKAGFVEQPLWAGWAFSVAGAPSHSHCQLLGWWCDCHIFSSMAKHYLLLLDMAGHNNFKFIVHLTVAFIIRYTFCRPSKYNNKLNGSKTSVNKRGLWLYFCKCLIKEAPKISFLIVDIIRMSNPATLTQWNTLQMDYKNRYVPSCWVRSEWIRTLLLRSSTLGDLPYTLLPFQLRLLSPGSQRSDLSLLEGRNRKSNWITLHRFQLRHLISNIGVLVITKSGVTFHRCEVNAQTWDRIPGDVIESGWFAAFALVCSNQTSEVLTSAYNLLVLISVQH